MAKFTVYYMTPNFFRDGSMGSKWLVRQNMLPTQAQVVNDTHIELGEVKAEDANALFFYMQGENWSPNGEARELIRSKGLQHTSMSVGDAFLDHSTNEMFMVDRFGFKKLEN